LFAKCHVLTNEGTHVEKVVVLQEEMRRRYFIWKLFTLRRDFVVAANTKSKHDAAAADMKASHEADIEKAAGSSAQVATLKKARTSCVRALDDLRRKREQQVRSVVFGMYRCRK
jgi:hypothetical protein